MEAHPLQRLLAVCYHKRTCAALPSLLVSRLLDESRNTPVSHKGSVCLPPNQRFLTQVMPEITIIPATNSCVTSRFPPPSPPPRCRGTPSAAFMRLAPVRRGAYACMCARAHGAHGFSGRMQVFSLRMRWNIQNVLEIQTIREYNRYGIPRSFRCILL